MWLRLSRGMYVFLVKIKRIHEDSYKRRSIVVPYIKLTLSIVVNDSYFFFLLGRDDQQHPDTLTQFVSLKLSTSLRMRLQLRHQRGRTSRLHVQRISRNVSRLSSLGVFDYRVNSEERFRILSIDSPPTSSSRNRKYAKLEYPAYEIGRLDLRTESP